MAGLLQVELSDVKKLEAEEVAPSGPGKGKKR